MVRRLSIKHPALTVAEPVREGNAVLDNIVRLLGDFGFQQITPPPVEEAKLFRASALLRHRFGQNLLPLEPQSGSEFVLVPTHLPGLVRLYFAAAASRPRVAKWFYVAPLVKDVRRDLLLEHELGIFILGDESALAAVQLINILSQSFRALGLPELTTELSSRGCAICQREYQEVLQGFLQNEQDRLCQDCLQHLGSRAVNVFSCPVKNCQALLAGAPPMMDFLDEACREELAETLEILDELSLPYELNPGLTGTLSSEKLLFRLNTAAGAMLGQGGNITALCRELGKLEPVPVMGFLSSLEHLAAFIPDESRRTLATRDVFVIPVGPAAARKALSLHRDLMQAGIRVSEAILENQGIKGQLRNAADRKCEIALIIGQKEAMDETVILRDIRSGMQEIFTVERIVEEVQKRLGK